MPPKKNNKGLVLFLVILVLVVLILALIAYLRSERPGPNTLIPTAEKVSAIQKGIDWLENTDQTFDVMSLWVASEINNTCESEDLNISLEDRKEASLALDDWQEPYLRLLDSEYEFEFNADKLKDQTERSIDEFLLPAIYCDTKGISQVNIELLKNYSDEGSYLTTNTLLAAAWIKNNGCIGDEEIRTIIEAKAAEVLDYLEKNNEYSDLFVTQIATLEYAGFMNRIRSDWTQTILDNQEENGGWMDTEITEEVPTYHATVYATWALVQNTGKCE